MWLSTFILVIGMNAQAADVRCKLNQGEPKIVENETIKITSGDYSLSVESDEVAFGTPTEPRLNLTLNKKGIMVFRTHAGMTAMSSTGGNRSIRVYLPDASIECVQYETLSELGKTLFNP